MYRNVGTGGYTSQKKKNKKKKQRETDMCVSFCVFMGIPRPSIHPLYTSN